jgi:lipopolysaccharide biosynthesis glycosyltransferase
VAYGDKAKREAVESINSLWQHNPQLPVTVIGEDAPDIGGIHFVEYHNPGYGGRWAKLNIDKLVGADAVAYLDADTRIQGNLSPAFDMVADGFDLVIAPSRYQGAEVFQHIAPVERVATAEQINNPLPLQLQAGVMFFNRRNCAPLFEAWRHQWLKYEQQDQAALVRALDNEPVRIALLGTDWNSQDGEIIKHLFGRAR